MTIIELLKTKYEVKRTRDRREVRICCPVCNDTNYHLYISLVKRISFCHRCNEVIPLLKLLEKDSSQLRKQFTLEEGELKESKRCDSVNPVQLPETTIPALRHADAKQYMLDRDFSEQDLKDYQVGYCREGWFAHRLIIPIFVYKELKGFVARTITDARPKYLYNKGFSKSTVLFNLQKASDSTLPLVITEGCFDAMRVGYNAVAILGTYLSNEQKYLLLNHLRQEDKIVVLLDADATGKALVMCEELEPYFDVSISILDHDDPADRTSEELFDIINAARPYSMELYKELLV